MVKKEIKNIIWIIFKSIYDFHIDEEKPKRKNHKNFVNDMTNYIKQNFKPQDKELPMPKIITLSKYSNKLDDLSKIIWLTLRDNCNFITTTDKPVSYKQQTLVHNLSKYIQKNFLTK